MSRNYAKRMSHFGTSFLRDIYAMLFDPELIGFCGGSPAEELYPMTDYIVAANKAFEKYGAKALSYDVTDGFEPLRKMTADARMKKVGVDVGADEIMIINGSQQGLDFVARLFIDEGDVIITEGPTYMAALNSFNACMPKIVQVSMDENGMKMDELEKALCENKNTKFIYTIPDFQNPSGICMSEERRKRMVQLAKDHDVIIVEDNPYNELRYNGNLIPAIKSFDDDGRVVYLGTYSKIIVPGARIGWICCSLDLRQQFVKLKQCVDLQPNTTSQKELATYIEMFDLEKHIDSLPSFYKKKSAVMLGAMDKHFPKWAKYNSPDGGLFVWVELPKSIDAMELFNRCVAEEKVAFMPGQIFFDEAKGNENYMRMSYSSSSDEDIEAGIERIARVLKTYDV